MLYIDESQNGRDIELRLGETVAVRLSENPTAGFRWKLDSSGAPVCTLVENDYQPSASAPGAGGIHRWQFQAAQVGEGRIELSSRRSWEGQGQAARTFTLRIRVAK